MVSDSESERPRKIPQPENDLAKDFGNERHSRELFARSMFSLLCAILGEKQACGDKSTSERR